MAILLDSTKKWKKVIMYRTEWSFFLFEWRKNEVITRTSSKDGKEKFLPIYARFYHLLGVIDDIDLTRGKKLFMQINVRLIFSKLCRY